MKIEFDLKSYHAWPAALLALLVTLLAGAGLIWIVTMLNDDNQYKLFEQYKNELLDDHAEETPEMKKWNKKMRGKK